MSIDDQVLTAENCNSMAQVRAGVDAIDVALVELLARRFAYMNAAARIKTDRKFVRDEPRKQQVLDNVRNIGSQLGVPEAVIGQLWEMLVEASIAYELERWDSLREQSI